MKKNNIRKAFYAILPLLVIGITLGYTCFPIALLCLLGMLCCTTRHTIGFFLVTYGGPLGGCIRAMYPSLPIYGLLLQLIGFILLWDVIGGLLKKNSSAVLYLIITLVIFGIFYILGPRNDFASSKYTDMCINAIVALLGYYALSSSSKIDVEGLTCILLLASICLYSFVISYYSMQPGTFFDYDWFRSQNMEYYYSMGNEHTLVGYQHIGMLIAYAVAVLLSQTKLKPANTAFYMLCASQLVLMSGCRQAILGVAVVAALRFAVFRLSNTGRRNFFGRFIGICLGLVAAYVVIETILSSINSEVVSSTLEEGDTGRMLLYAKAIDIFMNNPLTGAGIGGFNSITGDAWPHNFFLELLCECGIIGTLLLLFIVINSLSRKHAGLLYVNSSNMFYFLILSALFVRVLVSSDLPESIELFSAVFAIAQVRKTNLNTSINYIRQDYNEEYSYGDALVSVTD